VAQYDRSCYIVKDMTSKVRATRSDGLRSRTTILQAAASLATVEGLDGLSIARLAEYIGMSKSGLFSHFGSKEELQLATIDTALEIFHNEVIYSSIAIDDPLSRLEGLCERFIDHLDRKVFPGGCFFAAAAAEFATHPGTVQDRVMELSRNWMLLLEELVDDARARGLTSEAEDTKQIAYELDAALLMANWTFVLYDDPKALERAMVMVRDRIARLRATAPGSK
jgi:AcrR family transcriptional regulator